MGLVFITAILLAINSNHTYIYADKREIFQKKYNFFLVTDFFTMAI
jgi:hypothetical protein